MPSAKEIAALHVDEAKAWQAELHRKLVEADKRWKGDQFDLVARFVAAGIIPPPKHFTVDSFLAKRIDWGRCRACDKPGIYNPDFDAYRCSVCGRWLDLPSCEPDCILCKEWREPTPVVEPPNP